MKAMTILAAAALLASPRVATAHGGEDHGAAAPAAASGPGADGKRTAAGVSAAFELVLKFGPPATGSDASLLVFLSDFATNAPIENAKHELEIAASPIVKVVAEPAGSPGVYHAVVKVAPGMYSIVATIEAGTALDLVEIKDVDLTPAVGDREDAATPHATMPWLAIGGGIAGLVALMLIIMIVRRRINGRETTVATLVVALLGAPVVARAHGGEDHDPAPKAGTKAPIAGTYLAKESQFLLGIRTALIGEREIEARVQAVGRVVPRVDGRAEIAAPQPGRIRPIGGRPLPFIGDKVKKGQPLLVIEQTLSAADSGAIQSQAIQARSAVAQTHARRDQAQRELDRRTSLAGVVAERDIQQAALDLQLAEKDLELAQQQARLFGGGGLQTITITAPIDGTIAEASVAVGAQVAADAKLYTIIEASTLWVEAQVFEADLGRIEQLGAANITVDGYDRIFAGTLYRLGQVVDPATRTVTAIFAVDNAKGSSSRSMARRASRGSDRRRVLGCRW